MSRRMRAAAAVASLTATCLALGAGTASAAVGQPLDRYYSFNGDSTFLHWTTTDPSQPPADYQPYNEGPLGYTVPSLPGTVAITSCTWSSEGATRQYLSVDPSGCAEGGAVAATVESAGLDAPTITTVEGEGYVFTSPPDGVAAHPLYRCVARNGTAYLITPFAPGDAGCGEAPQFYAPDELLGYFADVPVVDAPADLPEAPAAGLLLLAAGGVAAGGWVLSRRRRTGFSRGA